jgi:hypothetical protein
MKTIVRHLKNLEHPPQWAFHFLKCSMNSGRKNTYVRCFPITLEKLVQVYMAWSTNKYGIHFSQFHWLHPHFLWLLYVWRAHALIFHSFIIQHKWGWGGLGRGWKKSNTHIKIGVCLFGFD